jgi:hypothetical protein
MYVAKSRYGKGGATTIHFNSDYRSTFDKGVPIARNDVSSKIKGQTRESQKSDQRKKQSKLLCLNKREDREYCLRIFLSQAM